MAEANKPFTLKSDGDDAFRVTPVPVNLSKHQKFLAEITSEMISEKGNGNNRLTKTVIEVVDGVMRAGAPKKAPESDERKKFIKAASRVALPIVAKNFDDPIDILAEKISYEFMPKNGPSSNPDANLIADDIKTAFATDNYVRRKFAEKIKEQLIENRVELYRSIKIDASGVPEPVRTYTPFEQAFKDMVGNVITKMAGIMPGTEKYEVITNNMVIAAVPEIKAQSDLLNDPAKAGKVMAARLMEPKKGEEDLNTHHGQLAYEIRVQADKDTFGFLATDDRIKDELASTIEKELKRIKKDNKIDLIALLSQESAVAKRRDTLPAETKLPPEVIKQSLPSVPGAGKATTVPYEEPVAPLSGPSKWSGITKTGSGPTPN